MARSFDLVDYKVMEAEFFLTHIQRRGVDLFAVQFYVSAFVSSARSVTFALQASLKDTPGFADWYKSVQERLRVDPIARFFHEFRRINQHTGENLVGGGSFSKQNCIWHFTSIDDLTIIPERDVYKACLQYFSMILSIVYDVYTEFGAHVDPKQHYTKEHFKKIGKTIDDAEYETLYRDAELAYRLVAAQFGSEQPVCNGKNLEKKILERKVPANIPEEYRWQIVRDSQPGCKVNHIFTEYLGKTTPEPERVSKPYES